jgi:hypothetical protein
MIHRDVSRVIKTNRNFQNLVKTGADSNLKTAENIVYCFKILEKIKISKIYVKKLDRILRLLMKIFFIKTSRLNC